MALCVEVGSGGSLRLMAVQPSSVAGCPYVVLSGAEAVSSPWVLSEADAATVGFSIVGVWLIGWGIRVVIRTVREDGRAELDV